MVATPGVKPWEIYQTRWSWPGAKNPNQYQEYNALLLAIQAGLMSRDAAIEEMGGDPIEVDRRQSEGKLRAEGFGLKYSTYYPPGVPPTAGPVSAGSSRASSRASSGRRSRKGCASASPTPAGPRRTRPGPSRSRRSLKPGGGSGPDPVA